MTKGSQRRLSILLAHRDATWVDQAKGKLVGLGYDVTDCLEPDWAPDLLGGSRPFTLAAVSSELDPSAQAEILRVVGSLRNPPKLVLVMDSLDSASVGYRSGGAFATYRISDGVESFVRLVAEQVGVPARSA